MQKTLMIAATAALLAASLCLADQPADRAKTIVLSTKRTPTNDGRQMYFNYCAPCHGADGKGRGPLAPSLKIAPADLSTLAQNNHGQYPASRIADVLQVGSAACKHRSSVMPAWGPILGQMNVAETNRTHLEEKFLRISSLNQYLESMQQK